MIEVITGPSGKPKELYAVGTHDGTEFMSGLSRATVLLGQPGK